MHWLGLMGRFGVMNVAWDSSEVRVGEQSAEQAFSYKPIRKPTQSAIGENAAGGLFQHPD
jgi:hypothetical protein